MYPHYTSFQACTKRRAHVIIQAKMSFIDVAPLNASISELQTQFESLMSAIKKTSAEFSAIAAQLNRPSFLEPLQAHLRTPEQSQQPPPIDTATPAAAKAAEALQEALQEAIHIDDPLHHNIQTAQELTDSLFDFLKNINPVYVQELIAKIDKLVEGAFNAPSISGVADRAIIYFSSQMDDARYVAEHLHPYKSSTQRASILISQYAVIHERITNIKKEMETFGAQPPFEIEWWNDLQINVDAVLSVTAAVIIEPSQPTLVRISELLHTIADTTEYIPCYKDIHIQAKFAISLIDRDCIGETALTVSSGIYSYIDSVAAHFLKMQRYMQQS